MRKIVVSKQFHNKKLQSFLLFSFNGLSSSMFFKALRKKDIKINGKRVSSNEVLHLNDIVEVYISDDILNGISKKLEIPIIYEDDNIHEEKTISLKWVADERICDGFYYANALKSFYRYMKKPALLEESITPKEDIK